MPPKRLSVSVLRAQLHFFSSVKKLHVTSKTVYFLNTVMLICRSRSGVEVIYLIEKSIKRQTKARDVLITDPPEHLGSHTQQKWITNDL